MKRLVYLISTFLILTGMYGGSVGAGDLFWISGQHQWSGYKIPARKFSAYQTRLGTADKRIYLQSSKKARERLQRSDDRGNSKLTFSNALAVAPEGWAAGFGKDDNEAKRAALKNCREKIGSNSCKIVDLNSKSAFIKQKYSEDLPKTSSSSSSLTASSSGSTKAWCATKKSVIWIPKDSCKRDGGKSYSSKSQAKAEQKRLYSASSSSSSTASSSGSTKVWCATKSSITWISKNYCKQEGGKSYSYKSQAEAEHSRLKGSSSSSDSTAYCYDTSRNVFFMAVSCGSEKKISKSEYTSRRLSSSSTTTTASSSSSTGETIKYSSGSKYVGETQHGKPHGQGTYTFPDSTNYVGGFKDGKMHGAGIFTYASGDKYVGQFKYGYRDGHGTMTWSDGDKYVGEWKSHKKNGQGTYTYANGDKYVGEFKDAIRNGHGTFTYVSGKKFVGEWKNDKRHGQGTITSPDGGKYVGEFNDDKPSEGITYLASGEIPFTVSNGEFCDGCEPTARQLALVASINASSSTTTQTAQTTTTQPSTVDKSALDLEFWQSIKDQENADMYRAYIDQFPEGVYVALAKIKLKTLGGNTSSVAQSSIPNLDYGDYYALVIGNNRYQHLGNLRTAVNDARSVASLLEIDYGFNVTKLENANREQIIKSISGLRSKVTSEDNVLIYYAGHGVLDKDADEGYWLPVDASRDNPANWVMTDQVVSQVRAMKAKHVMVVADSCFSGTITRGIKIEIKQPTREWLETIVKKKSRTALTSGGLEPVMDSGSGNNSVFANSFLSILRDNNGVLDASQLFSQLRPKVMVNSDQTPEYGDIHRAGHDGGDFLFVRQ